MLARAEFLQNDTLQVIRWLRIIGDTIFALGAFGFVWFVAGLRTGWSISERREELGSEVEAAEEAALATTS